MFPLYALHIWLRYRASEPVSQKNEAKPEKSAPVLQKEAASLDEHTNPIAPETAQSNIPAGSLAAPAGTAGQGPVSAPPLPAYQVERCPKRRAQGRDLILAGLLLAACFLLWDSIRFAVGLGLGEALGLAALLPAALWYLRNRPGKLRGFGLVCAVLYEIGALSLAFSGDSLLKALLLIGLPGLLVIVVLERAGLWTGAGLLSRLHDFCYAAFSMSFGRLNVGAWALTHTGAQDSVRSKRVWAVGLGLLCAVPVLFVLIPLLAASDAAFEGMLGSLDGTALLRGLVALLYGGFTALLVFSLLFSSDRGPKPLTGGLRKGVEPAAVAAFLGAVSAAYVLYLAAQFAYFTDAFRGLLPKDFTVAQYARRGFFEMCFIVAINLGLIVLALGLCRKEGGRVPAAVKALALFLCVFSLILVATALSKMFLYMNRFGLTRQRVRTSVFMLFLAAVVLALALRLFVKRVPVLRLAVGLGAAMLICLSLANVDGLVARYNVSAWKTGKLDSLDMQTVCELGDGAVPTLAELAACEDETVAAAAEKELGQRMQEFGLAWSRPKTKQPLDPLEDPTDLRSWNLITQQALNALQRDRNKN